jgi:hypothetical protein
VAPEGRLDPEAVVRELPAGLTARDLAVVKCASA